MYISNKRFKTSFICLLAIFLIFSSFVGSITFSGALQGFLPPYNLHNSKKVVANAYGDYRDNLLKSVSHNLIDDSRIINKINHPTVPFSLLVDHTKPWKYFAYSEYRIIPSEFSNRVSCEYFPADNYYLKSNKFEDSGLIQIKTPEIASKGYLTVGVNAPAYWEQGSTITITVTITSNALYPYRFIGSVTGQVRDTYKDPNTNTFYTKVEASASKDVILLNDPSATYYLSLSIEPDTTVGLKEVSVTLSGSMYYMGRLYPINEETNMGYNFVQKFSRPLFVPPAPFQSYYGNEVDADYYFENPESNVGGSTYLVAYGYDSWTIIKKAGEAADAVFERRSVPYEIGKNLTYWVHDHFEYDRRNINEGSEDFYYIDLDYTASALWLLTHPYNGYYRGVCDEYTVVLIAFARALNIAAHYLLAFVVDGNTYNGHAFAELWDGTRWVHADPTNRLYDRPTAYQIYNVLEILTKPIDSLKTFVDDIEGNNKEGISWDYSFIMAGPNHYSDRAFPSNNKNPWFDYNGGEGEFKYAVAYPNGEEYFNTYIIVTKLPQS